MTFDAREGSPDPWLAGVMTLYPEMFPGVLGHSLAGRALEAGRWGLKLYSPWQDMPKSVRVDDTPYGGGAGMVMRPDRLEATVERMLADFPGASRVMMSPRGRPLTQAMVASMVEVPPVILCGHFEAVDQRVLDAYGFEEVSVADVVLSGGEVAAMVLLDACVRLLPGVIGNVSTHEEESFGYAGGLLEYSHYTKPASWCGREVPEVLLSGHHAEIARWRLETSTVLTYQRRPDVYLRALLSWAQGQGGVVE